MTHSFVPPFCDAEGGLAGGREHEEEEVDVAEDGQLLGLLEDPRPPLRVGDVPPAHVLQLLHLELHPPHAAAADRWFMHPGAVAMDRAATPTGNVLGSERERERRGRERIALPTREGGREEEEEKWLVSLSETVCDSLSIMSGGSSIV
jgi:hypothetical protein